MRWTRTVRAGAAALALLAALAGCGLIDLSPFAVSSWPSQRDQVLPSAPSVWIEFSEPVREDIVQPLVSVRAAGQTLAGDFSWTGNRLTFTPVKPFEPGVRHLLQLQGTVRTTAGRVFDELFLVPFYVGTSSPPPVITSTAPSTGGVVGVLTPLSLTFSQPMDAASFRDSFSVTPLTDFSVTWDPSGTEATVTPISRWNAQGLYTWTVATACKSGAGVAVGRTWTGTFLVQSDATSPSLVAAVPAVLSGGAVLPMGTSLSQMLFGQGIELSFSKDIDLSTLTTAFSISPSVAGTMRRVSATGDFFFAPSDEWIMGQEYLLTISTDLRDLSGNPLTAPYRQVFTPAIPAQAVTAIDISGSLTGTLPTAAPLNSAAPFLLAWVGSGTVPDSGLVLNATIHFAQPYDPDLRSGIAGGIRLAAFFPSTTISPQVLQVDWLSGQVVHIAWTGFRRSANSPSIERLYYKLTIPGGRDQTRNQSGSFMTDPVTVLLESGSDS